MEWLRIETRHRNEGPATNSLSHGTAFCIVQDLKDSVRTVKKTLSVSVTKTVILKLRMGNNRCSFLRNGKNLLTTLCGQNVEIFNVKPGGK
jgi:hypothetical protein